MSINEYIKRADYNDIKNIVEFIRKNIEENKFYFDFEENGENSYKIYEEDYVKKLLDKGDDILLYIENGQIVGLSHWTSVYGIPYNLYTVSDGHNSKKGIAKKLYYYFLKQDIPVAADFVIYLPTSSKIFKIWENHGIKISGFASSFIHKDSKNNLYTTIIGYRSKDKILELKIPKYSEKFFKNLCTLNNLDCKIYTFEYKRKENNEKYPKLIYTTNIKEYEEKGYYLTGFLYNNGQIIYAYSSKVDKNVKELIKKFFNDLKREDMKNTILEYIDNLSSM
ncbi:hypothetical protein DDW05_01655 [Candidatus Nanobsidianus stetteri]|uniref:Uncharacterized protein n=1 Tax=Nanobsidianus stetteri TaxID=1294122 RepID=A0A2T9WTT1_NANST|nr:hypothetical protein DDW05_01655 [Candidatus Nanobsidianus stetteri]